MMGTTRDPHQHEDESDRHRRRRGFARTHLAGDLLEQFFVSAVVALLGIRIYLSLTGFPQVGGGTLHIAHILWGGLLMLVALVLSMTFLGRRVRTWVAILGGLGFGTFVDELGKFITADNDYLYRPSWIVIYLVFIALFLAFTALSRRERPRGRAATATALDMMESSALYGLSRNDHRVILRLLDAAGDDDALGRALRDAVDALPEAGIGRPGRLRRVQNRARDAYRSVTRSGWFRPLIVALWAVFALTTGGVTVAAIVRDPAFHPNSPALGITDLVQVAVVVLSAVLAGIGIARLGRRVVALQWFRLAILVSLLLGLPLALFDDPALATGGLLVDLVCLGVFNYGISVELADEEERTPGDDGLQPGFLGAPLDGPG